MDIGNTLDIDIKYQMRARVRMRLYQPWIFLGTAAPPIVQLLEVAKKAHQDMLHVIKPYCY